MLEKDSYPPLAKLFLGKTSLSENDFPIAISYLQEAVKYLPNSGQAHYNLGYAYYCTGNFQQSLTEYLLDLKSRPQHIPTLATLAVINFEKGWFDECIKHCSKILEISPKNTIAQCLSEMAENHQKYSLSKHLTKAVVACYENEYEKAIDEINAFLQKDGKNPFAYSLLGNIEVNRKNLEKAVDYFESSLKIEPLSSSYKNLAYISLIKKDFNQAISFFEKALKIAPQSLEIYWELGIIYNRQGDAQKAIAYFEKIKEIDFQSPIPYIMLSSLYQRSGDFDKAIDEIKEMGNYNPTEPSQHLLQATLYLKQ